jgi:hypothetical protein
VRIPLDYYRILGVPRSATEEQINQAYHDRALQLPRREYSDAAINARKQLLDEAYSTLCDPQARSRYDQTLAEQQAAQGQKVALPLAEGSRGSSPTALQTPWLDIPKPLFIGAVLILLELGEYETVLELGETYLDDRNSISLDKGTFGEPQLVRADLVLTMALACLELGRDQWQQRQYENAAASGQVGQRLLLKENLFPSVRGEIQSDLYKLRPYQILELLALPETQVQERRKGLRLLKEMLEERGGIDGKGDDHSGLSVDDFLRFIQQLRTYLTAAEQQELFEAEARRPSAVATYLAVYAFIGRGFTQREPRYIQQGRELLVRLGRRQDVYLEQAVCSILLGQTEQASYALEKSQEKETLAFIQEHSQDSPDLLPGLCLYAEQWLQKEVFPHFRDLASQSASLKEYFADKQVQTYLEQMPVEAAPSAADEWAVVEPTQAQEITVARPAERSQYHLARVGQENTSSTLTYAPVGAKESTATVGGITPANRVPPSGNGKRTPSPASPQPPSHGAEPSRRQRRMQKQLATAPLGEPISQPMEREATQKPSRGLIWGVAGLLGLGILGWIIYQVAQGFSSPRLDPNQPLVSLNEPPVAIPEPGSLPRENGALNPAKAQEVLNTWLSTKAQALGESHNVEALDEILVDPVLSRWERSAIATQRNNAYWQYDHTLNIESVEFSEEQPNQGTVTAQVQEGAQYYQGGELQESASYEDNLRVRYQLVRVNDQWKIQNWEVL